MSSHVSESSTSLGGEYPIQLPSYREAVGSEGEIALTEIFPPPTYESLFTDGTSHVLCAATPVSGQPSEASCASAVGTQNMLEALDKEFKWTALSVGLLVSVLVVLVLIIIVIAFPREDPQ